MKFVTYWVLSTNKSTVFHHQQPEDMQQYAGHRHFSMMMHPVLPHEVPLL